MNSKKSTVTEAERLELAAKLDKDLEDFIDSLEKRPYTEGWPEDRWQEEMEKHPFFMKKAPEPGQQLHPLMEGLQKLKYDPEENSPEELANAYKDDGNFNFKHKNYRLAVIAYTEGIKVKCGNPDVEATLHNNRSAANYFLKNYRSALRDAELALKLKPNYEKALVRAAHCCYETEQYQKALNYCHELVNQSRLDRGILDLAQKCVEATKVKERDVRKQVRQEQKKTGREKDLLNEIKKRGVTIEGELRLENLDPQVPQLAENRVYLNEEELLVWPVVFLYPESRKMDFLQGVAENETVQDHIEHVFQTSAEWDLEKKYKPGNIKVYFENKAQHKLYSVGIDKALGDVLKLKEYVVHGGTPSFLLFAKGCSAEYQFLNRYGFLRC